MFKTEESSRDFFLQQTKVAREERAYEKERELAACCIQKCIRSWLNRVRFTRLTLAQFDGFFHSGVEDDKNQVMKPAVQVYETTSKFLIIYKKERDKERMENLCKYLVHSLSSESASFSYIGVALMKDKYIFWILQLKRVLCYCLLELKDLHPEVPSDYKSILLRLHTLMSFTSTRTWAIMKAPEMEKLKTGMNQLCANVVGYLVNRGLYPIMQILLIKSLCRRTITLQSVALKAVSTLTFRPLIFSKMTEKLLLVFLVNIFSVPSLMHHLKNNDQFSSLPLYKENHLFSESIKFLSCEKNLKAVFSQLKGNNTLCLLANLVDLANAEENIFSNEMDSSNFVNVVTNLLKECQQYVVLNKSTTTYWHPILGWFDQPEDYSLQESIPIIKMQLSHLWTGNIIADLMCKPLCELTPKDCLLEPSSHNSSGKSNVISKFVSEVRAKKYLRNKQYYPLGSPETTKIAITCSLYYTLICTLREMKSIILTSLCYQDKRILYNLWLFLRFVGPNHGLKDFLDHFNQKIKHLTPELQMLMIFCDCMTHYITILDDIEMYEQQDPFRLSDFAEMSHFLNQFLYKSISNNLFDTKTSIHGQFLTSLLSLLNTIYRRDCHKRFCSEDHWLIKEVRASNFLADFDKGTNSTTLLLSKMPHILLHSDRVLLFRRYIASEKAANETSLSSTLITVHRSRLVEDGYRQLSMLSPKALKGVIRVRFINELGLDEAGIDQDGVFKEFLEETIKRVFDPTLNLFKETSENRLYPSSTSSVHDDHLLLFEFIGRMLGKAVYEGIIVDVPFASFFVSQFCGQAGGMLYSWLDELASLDQDLYRSLSVVKHYEGDVSDLELTFSLDENVLGKIVSHEIKQGGRAIPVTNENKINYIHLMARFRMYEQIKEQITAFTKGFRSIINSDWLSLFSTPEWQRLISGDNVPLNLRDLRKHTQYYGGFHDKHRVICWLWDILEKDFTENEKSLFLKFVTSCSKAPLLGFAHLEPPFSIRCVEVCDDEDTGDTIGSIIRGFFKIHKKEPLNRLPTSSTCFNLLKLPNYQKKATLREKLRYAITSNTGFELS